eukprot:ANDGO_07234.mRNA.1 hypothetical protein
MNFSVLLSCLCVALVLVGVSHGAKPTTSSALLADICGNPYCGGPYNSSSGTVGSWSLTNVACAGTSVSYAGVYLDVIGLSLTCQDSINLCYVGPLFPIGSSSLSVSYTASFGSPEFFTLMNGATHNASRGMTSTVKCDNGPPPSSDALAPRLMPSVLALVFGFVFLAAYM